MSAAPLTREARKAQTREAIITAAKRLFAFQGIEATSLDRIASEVGLTKGAIYSTFASKDELVYAVAEATSFTVDAAVLVDPAVPLKDGLRSLGRDIHLAHKRFGNEWIILDLELFLYERRHSTWGTELAEQRRAGFTEFARELDAVMKKRGEKLPVPAMNFCHGLQALALGVVRELESDPKAFTKQSLIDLFGALAE